MTVALQSYLLRPLDTLFFRGGEPFNAGDDHFVRSQFPPTPRTLQGIVRTRLLQQSGVDLTDQRAVGAAVGVGDVLPDDLHVRGPFPALDGEPWFPAPRYLVRDCEERWHRVVAKTELRCDPEAPPALPACPPAGFAKPIGGWISSSLMQRVLWGELPEDCAGWSGARPLWREEIRTGIARDGERKVAEQSHLYSIGHIRLEEGGALRFQCSRNVGAGLMSVGGEGRLASFEDAPESSLDLPLAVAKEICNCRHLWLVLVQPARFERGWKSDFGADEMLGLEVELVTAVIGPPQMIGGFDMANKRPNPVCCYVPAGSGYLLRLKGNLPNDAPTRLQRLHNDCVLGHPQERQMGFGHVMIGKVFE